MPRPTRRKRRRHTIGKPRLYQHLPGGIKNIQITRHYFRQTGRFVRCRCDLSIFMEDCTRVVSYNYNKIAVKLKKIVAKVSLLNGEIHNLSVYSFGENSLGNNSLGSLKIGNVGDDGSICWGGVPLFRRNTIAKAWNTFWNSPFNDDLGSDLVHADTENLVYNLHTELCNGQGPVSLRKALGMIEQPVPPATLYDCGNYFKKHYNNGHNVYRKVANELHNYAFRDCLLSEKQLEETKDDYDIHKDDIWKSMVAYHYTRMFNRRLIQWPALTEYLTKHSNIGALAEHTYEHSSDHHLIFNITSDLKLPPADVFMAIRNDVLTLLLSKSQTETKMTIAVGWYAKDNRRIMFKTFGGKKREFFMLIDDTYVGKFVKSGWPMRTMNIHTGEKCRLDKTTMQYGQLQNMRKTEDHVR